MLRWGKVELTGGFLLVAALLFYLDTDGTLLWAGLAMGLHELGHYTAVRLLGGRITYFRLTAVGGDMGLDRRRPLSYGRELAALLAGPGVNLALAWLSARLAGGREVLYLFAGLNLSLGVLNLLPIWPLDGGRAFSILLTALLSPEWARRGAQLCSVLLVAALTASGAALLWRTGTNFTLLVMALWLSAGLFQPKREKWAQKARRT